MPTVLTAAEGGAITMQSVGVGPRTLGPAGSRFTTAPDSPGLCYYCKIADPKHAVGFVENNFWRLGYCQEHSEHPDVVALKGRPVRPYHPPVKRGKRHAK